MATFIRTIGDEGILAFVRALTAAAPLRYVAALSVPDAAGGPVRTWVYLEDKLVALAVCVAFDPAAPAGQQVRMDVLLAAEAAAAAQLMGSLMGQPGAEAGQIRLRYADLATGDDVIGFAGALRRLGRVAVPHLVPTLGPDLGDFGWPGPAAGPRVEFARELRSRLRAVGGAGSVSG